MMGGGAGRGRRAWDMTYWVWPLPPEGTIGFACEWTSEGIAFTEVEMDAAVICAASEDTIASLAVKTVPPRHGTDEDLGF